MSSGQKAHYEEEEERRKQALLRDSSTVSGRHQLAEDIMESYQSVLTAELGYRIRAVTVAHPDSWDTITFRQPDMEDAKRHWRSISDSNPVWRKIAISLGIERVLASVPADKLRQHLARQNGAPWAKFTPEHLAQELLQSIPGDIPQILKIAERVSQREVLRHEIHDVDAYLTSACGPSGLNLGIRKADAEKYLLHVGDREAQVYAKIGIASELPSPKDYTRDARRRDASLSSITGEEIIGLKTDLLLSRGDFASILGVHGSTVGRWIKKGSDDVNVEPLQRQILSALTRITEGKSEEEKRTLGKRISNTLTILGNLAALYSVLDLIYGEHSTTSRPGGVA